MRRSISKMEKFKETQTKAMQRCNSLLQAATQRLFLLMCNLILPPSAFVTQRVVLPAYYCFITKRQWFANWLSLYLSICTTMKNDCWSFCKMKYTVVHDSIFMCLKHSLRMIFHCLDFALFMIKWSCFIFCCALFVWILLLTILDLTTGNHEQAKERLHWISDQTYMALEYLWSCICNAIELSWIHFCIFIEYSLQEFKLGLEWTFHGIKIAGLEVLKLTRVAGLATVTCVQLLLYYLLTFTSYCLSFTAWLLYTLATSLWITVTTISINGFHICHEIVIVIVTYLWSVTAMTLTYDFQVYQYLVVTAYFTSIYVLYELSVWFIYIITNLPDFMYTCWIYTKSGTYIIVTSTVTFISTSSNKLWLFLCYLYDCSVNIGETSAKLTSEAGSISTLVLSTAWQSTYHLAGTLYFASVNIFEWLIYTTQLLASKTSAGISTSWEYLSKTSYWLYNIVTESSITICDVTSRALVFCWSELLSKGQVVISYLSIAVQYIAELLWSVVVSLAYGGSFSLSVVYSFLLNTITYALHVVVVILSHLYNIVTVIALFMLQIILTFARVVKYVLSGSVQVVTLVFSGVIWIFEEVSGSYLYVLNKYTMYREILFLLFIALIVIYCYGLLNDNDHVSRDAITKDDIGDHIVEEDDNWSDNSDDGKDKNVTVTETEIEQFDYDSDSSLEEFGPCDTMPDVLQEFETGDTEQLVD